MTNKLYHILKVRGGIEIHIPSSIPDHLQRYVVKSDIEKLKDAVSLRKEH